MPYVIKNPLEFLSEASKILSSSLDYHLTLVIIAKLVVSNFADFCMIDIFEDGKMKRLAVKIADPKKQKMANLMFQYPPDPRNKKAIYEAYNTGNPIVIRRVTKKWLKTVSRINEERELVEKLNLKSFIFAPLKSRKNVIGVLTIASSKNDFHYSSDDGLLANEIAGRAGIAVDKARLFSELQDAILTRDEFLSIASHELKTPLTSILLNLQQILHKIKNSKDNNLNKDQIIQMIETSEKQSKRMASLINDLLNVSVLSTGRLQIEKERMDLNNSVIEVLNRFDTQMKKLKIPYKLITCPGTIGNWDKVRIEQVISNLISNAIKYGRGKLISIEVKKVDNQGVLIVSDKGIGVSKKDQEKIFGRFNRAVTQKDYKGLGIGLYISKQIVEAHNGKVTVKSQKNKGSTFTLFLPL